MPARVLRTDRLVLRDWRESDRAPFAALNADPAVMEHFPSTLDRGRCDAFIDRQSALLDQRSWGIWALEADGEFLGFTGLAVPSFDAPFMPAVEIGWRLARPAWGHGYATEAARAVVALAFTSQPAGLGLAELVSFTATTNQRSRRVMERLGMTHDQAGDFDHPAVPEGHAVRRHVLYRLHAGAVTSDTGARSAERD